MEFNPGMETGAERKLCSRFSFHGGARLMSALVFLLLSGLGCSLFATRPVQQMSDASAALRAAREVQADTLAAGLFREANEVFLRARREYHFRNYSEAETFADEARQLAERAEFEAVKSGGVRAEAGPPPGPAETPIPEPYPYPQPTGTPAEEYEQRAQRQQEQPSPPVSPSPASPK